MKLEDLHIDFNYHTHTKRNGHGGNSEDNEFVESAINTGITILGFSEHCPFKDEELNCNQSKVRMKYDRLEEYLSSIDELSKKYSNQCTILKGFECEYYPNHIDTIIELKNRVDYIILGEHFTTLDDSTCHSFTIKCSDEEAVLYADLICEGLETGLFDYLAHPDYFFSGTNDINEVFIESSHRICKKCEETKTPIEININGSAKPRKIFKQGDHLGYPNRIFWEIASQYNLDCVLGFDAHFPCIFDRKEELLKNIDKEIGDLNLNIITHPFIYKKK